MTALLLKLFIKNHHDTSNNAVREKYGLLSGVIGIFLNTTLFAIKIAVGYVTGSIAVTADAFNNLTDSASSLLTLFGFKLSNKPADREHPFGHGRSEEIVSLIIAASILVLSYEFIRTSINHILEPPEMYSNALMIGLLFFSVLVKLWMFLFNKHLSKKIKSGTLYAIAIDSRNDVFITSTAILSVVFTSLTGIVIDGFVGIFIALMLLRSGYHLAKDNLTTILGRPIDKDTADRIKQIVTNFDGIIGVHDLIVHNYGPGRKLATLHGEVPKDTSFAASHALGESAEAAVLEELGIHIIIRLDPVDTEDERLHTLKVHIAGFLTKAHPEANAHDFRMMDNTLIFELEIPYEYRENDRLSLVAALEAIVEATDSSYRCVINVEYGFIARE